MSLFSRPRGVRFCAFCKSPRKVYLQKHVELTNVLTSSLLAIVASFALWGQADPRAMMLLALLLGLSEISVYLRWRTAIVCKMCGFDPVVYKKSPARASSMVREFFDMQMTNPHFHLSKSPLLDLQRRLKIAERIRQKYERTPSARAMAVVDQKPL